MFGWFRRAPTAPTAEQLRVTQALIGYPPYAPPEWNPDLQSMGEATNEYNAFFIENRDRRLEALRGFLAKFDVALNLDDSGATAVSAWCPLYADLLVDGFAENVFNAYHDFACPWTGTILGLNVIFDLGLYVGECVLYRNRKLKWRPRRGPEVRNVIHFIVGQKSERPFDPFFTIYDLCQNIRVDKRGSRAGKRIVFVKQDSLYRLIKAEAMERWPM